MGAPSPMGGGLRTVMPGATRVVVRGLVVDSGEGPHLCLGGATGDFWPECNEDGIPLVGWTWPPPTGTERRAAGYVSGDYALVGTYDGSRFTVDPSVPVTSAIANRPPAEPVSQSISICPPPPGGWPKVAPPGTTQDAYSAVNDLAQTLPGYGGSWIDYHNSRGYAMNTGTFNVLVTHDVDGAERKLRTVWPGSLCVGLTTYTVDQLEQIDAQFEKLPGYVEGGGLGLQSRNGKDTGKFVIGDVAFLYDDGTLQRELDERYGVGLVEITTFMKPYTR